MNAFWCVRPAVQDVGGGWDPSFPAGFAGLVQVYGDLRVFGPDPAPGDHKHAQTGAIALGTDHYHWMVFAGNAQSWYQDYVGPVASSHSHVIPVERTHFMVFVVCTDAAYAQLLIDVPNIIILGHADVTAVGGEDYTIGDIINVAWSGADRTSWENTFNNFGMDLPEAITNDRRLVRWLMSVFFNTGQNMSSDLPYRYRSVVGVG